MTDTTHLPAEITAYLRALLAAGCREAVGRVRDAPYRAWDTGHSSAIRGRRCLVGIAEGPVGTWPPRSVQPRMHEARWAAVTAWDGWARSRGVGLRRASAAVRGEAGRLMEERDA